MPKILFICDKTLEEPLNGGSYLAARNYNAVVNFFGKENVEFFYLYNYYLGYEIKHKLLKKTNLFIDKPFGFLSKNEKELLNKVKDKNFVFIDRTLCGRLAKVIRREYNNVKIISFFHNVEYDYVKYEYKNFIGKMLACKIAFYNEKCACNYSDVVIALNFRDSLRIEKLYNRKVERIIPVSFPDEHISFNKSKINEVQTALFLGSNFFANIHGITWFVENVLPFVSINLKIVGKDMNKTTLPKNDKIEILGYVENLETHIQNADFMIFPIFKGSGMKVKTCEALMHGKNIIGTSEAFMGYDIDCEKVGAKCETAEGFIQTINEFSQTFKSKFNDYSRNVFLQKYTDKIALEKFNEVFKNYDI